VIIAGCAAHSADVRRGLLLMDDVAAPGTPLAAASIYTVRADGADKITLTGPGNQYGSWTPDGRILFVSNRSGATQLWIMDGDGANATQLGDLSPLEPIVEITRVQMADTGLVAFRSGGDGVWLVERDGSNLREVVKFANGAGDAPSLARSGTWLTYTAPATATPGHNEIFRIDVDGTQLEQLTFPDDADYPDGNASSIAPDELSIAIYTGVESHAGETFTSEHHNIALVGPHGGARTLLTSCAPIATPTAQLTIDQCITSDNPSWSPDGAWIVYDRGSTNPDGEGTWAVDVASHHIERLSPASSGGAAVPFRFP
jgi:Tol biopolymer transport system component